MFGGDAGDGEGKKLLIEMGPDKKERGKLAAAGLRWGLEGVRHGAGCKLAGGYKVIFIQYFSIPTPYLSQISICSTSEYYLIFWGFPCISTHLLKINIRRLLCRSSLLEFKPAIELPFEISQWMVPNGNG